MLWGVKALVLAVGTAGVFAQPFAGDDDLEPSVLNEVEHALAHAPTNGLPRSVALPFATNGLGRAQLAIRLVSAQRSDGRWLAGTNDVTRTAVELLKNLRDSAGGAD